VSATARTAVPAVYQVAFGHYTVTIFNVKIIPLLQVVGKSVAVAKNIVEIPHELSFYKTKQYL
jgi:hypothetical protein